MFGFERRRLSPQDTIFIQTAAGSNTTHFTAEFKNGKPVLQKLNEEIPEGAEKIIYFENKMFSLRAAKKRDSYGLSDYVIARFRVKRNGRNADYRSIYLVDNDTVVRLISVHSENECRAILEQFRKQAEEKLNGANDTAGAATSIVERGCGRSEFNRIMTMVLAAAANEL